MGDFSVGDMLRMQRELHARYQNQWEALSPTVGEHKLLWMIGEVGEVIDIVKKNGSAKAAGDAAIRAHLVEELADVLMYYHDILLCYGIDEDELKQAYIAKFERNMKRW